LWEKRLVSKLVKPRKKVMILGGGRRQREPPGRVGWASREQRGGH